MRSFHYNRHYNFLGVAFLAFSALLVFIVAYWQNLVGSANMALVPLMLGVFILGYFTGRPCLRIEEDHFEYRALPFGRVDIIDLDNITKIEVQDKEIHVYCDNSDKPVRIKSISFSKDELPEVTEFFLNLRLQLIA